MTRALLTDREREVLAGQVTDVDYPQKYESNTRTRVRQRIDKFEKDMEILETHEPEMAKQLRETLCEGSEQAKLHDVLDDIQNEIRELRDEMKETGKV